MTDWDLEDGWPEHDGEGEGGGSENEIQIDFDAIKVTTEDAHLVVVGDKEEWIPKSQIGELERTGGRFSSKGWLTIPEWLAIEKGLV